MVLSSLDSSSTTRETPVEMIIGKANLAPIGPQKFFAMTRFSLGG